MNETKNNQPHHTHRIEIEEFQNVRQEKGKRELRELRELRDREASDVIDGLETSRDAENHFGIFLVGKKVILEIHEHESTAMWSRCRRWFSFQICRRCQGLEFDMWH